MLMHSCNADHRTIQPDGLADEMTLLAEIRAQLSGLNRGADFVISFIIPAHNEELWIGQCLKCIIDAMKSVSDAYEIIVVDDSSTDATARIASGSGATVIHVDFRLISAVRNEGVRSSKGDILFFVDADTKANPSVITAALAALRSGAAAGGCVPELDGLVPLWGHVIHRIAVLGGRLTNLVGGCFLFCSRNVFEKVGGFSEQLRAGEDIAFVREIKKVGRFVVLKPPIVTSARKLEVAGPLQVIRLLFTIAIRGHNYESPWVIDLLYGKLAQQCRNPGNVGKELS